MTGFILIAVFITTLYVLKILAYKHNWERFPEFSVENGDGVTGISVIVAFRNELANLPGLLDSLAKQIYPAARYEVILVDDHSGDGSSGIAAQFCTGNKNFRLIGNSMKEKGKKAAILNGLKHATYGLIVTTDADCTMGECWLSSVAGFYIQHQPAMIVGLVDITETGGFFGTFREIEFLSLIAAGAAAAAAQKPLYCNGANLAYDKKAFQAFGDPLKKSVVSGDDTLFMLQLKKRTGNPSCF